MSRSRLHVAALAFAALAAAGCDKKIDAVCEEKCGSAAAACQTASATAEATAEERGCEGEFEALVGRLDAKSTCAGGALDPTPCAAETKALDACMQ